MKRKTKTKEDDLRIDYLDISKKLTPSERLEWLGETRKFLIKILPQSTQKKILKFRWGL